MSLIDTFQIKSYAQIFSISSSQIDYYVWHSLHNSSLKLTPPDSPTKIISSNFRQNDALKHVWTVPKNKSSNYKVCLNTFNPKLKSVWRHSGPMVQIFHYTSISLYTKKNFVPHCPEALRYAKVWGRDVVRNLTLAYAKRLFPDSNPWPTSHLGTTLPLHQDSPSV